MKKRIGLLSLLAFAGVALASCSGKGEKVETKDLYTLKDFEIAKLATVDVLHKENSKIPYVSLKDGVSLMSVVRSANLDSTDYKFEIKKENNEYIISNETGAKCTINKAKQTLVYDDFDKFAYAVPESQTPLSLLTLKANQKAIKVESSHYTPGNSVTIDLNKYSKLDIYEKDDICYLPVSVFNSVLFNVFESVNLAYNGTNFYLVSGDSLTTKLGGVSIPTALGEEFQKTADKDILTDEYVEYNYQSLLFDFDNVYGLKDKFTSFDDYLTKSNYKTSLLSKDSKEIDANLTYALSYLNDGHTAVSSVSFLYDAENSTIDKAKANPAVITKDENDAKFAKSKSDAGIKDGLEYKDDTVFVTFGKFNNIDTDMLYNKPSNKDFNLDDFTGLDNIPGIDFDFGLSEGKLSNTACLFNQLYKDLNSDQYKDTIKNVVVDLSSNDGGTADGLVYSLATLIGDITVDMINPLTGGHNHQVYKADINADGFIDSNDKSLAELGFKIYFLDSKYSFSSANAMPVLAKLNNKNVVTLGEKTAGGPCAVRYSVTPIGTALYSSSLTTIAKKVDNKYQNIDDGVAADHQLTEEQMIDRNYITTKINSWTSK